MKFLSYIVAHHMFDKNTKRVIFLFLQNVLSYWVMNCKSCQVVHKPIWKWYLDFPLYCLCDLVHLSIL